jgi:hypothetical protein
MTDQPAPIRLPSFNDFSPGILSEDVRQPLLIVRRFAGDRERAFREFAKRFFKGVDKKRASTNVPSTLTNTGLVDPETFTLTDFGNEVADQPTAQGAARVFMQRLILEHYGYLLIDAIRAIYRKRELGGRKKLLKRELNLLGVELSNATTDHTTFENWLITAGVVVEEGNFHRIDDAVLRELVGADDDEIAQLLSMDPGHRLFLQIVRRRAETTPLGEDMAAAPIYDECLRTAPAWFVEDQLRKKVVEPLEEAGWISASVAKSGKGGSIRAAEKLLRIPLDRIVPHAFGNVPGDIRSHLSRPREDINALLKDETNKHNRGLGLELLALRMLFDLGLEPRGFRLRARETSYAEVDLLAEGRMLLFSRWVIQCKNYSGGARVDLGDVAKEAGIAIHQKAHVVVMITTSDFTPDARKYATEMTRDTHLQFVLVDGVAVRAYLTQGEGRLTQFFLDNAAHVMQIKRQQLRLAASATDEINADKGSSN